MSYIGNQPADIGVYAVQAETGNGSLTAFTLDRAATTASISISIDGVDQIPTTAYAVTSGTTLTFTSAPPNLSVISIRFLGDTVSFGEPSDDSVATAKIQDDAVTAAKLANSINTEIAANTAKVTNATHTGDVTGSTALTIATDAVDIAMLSATGTADATTFLRGDNAWAAAGGDNTPAFQAWRITSSQSIAHDTDTKLEFQSEVYDTDSAYDNTTNFRFTVPVGEAGKYMFYCGVHADCETNGGFGTAIVRAKVNGSYMIIFNDTNYNAGYIRKASFAGSAVLDLAAADYVELYFQGSKSATTGTNFTITANATYYQSFWGCYKMIGI